MLRIDRPNADSPAAIVIAQSFEQERVLRHPANDALEEFEVLQLVVHRRPFVVFT